MTLGVYAWLRDSPEYALTVEPEERGRGGGVMGLTAMLSSELYNRSGQECSPPPLTDTEHHLPLTRLPLEEGNPTSTRKPIQL